MSDDRNGGPPPRVEVGSMAHAINLETSLFSFEGSDVAAIFGRIETAALPNLNLLLQTVIVPGARTNEGTLIEAVALPWFDIIAFLKADPSIALSNPLGEMGGNNSWCIQKSWI